MSTAVYDRDRPVRLSDDEYARRVAVAQWVVSEVQEVVELLDLNVTGGEREECGRVYLKLDVGFWVEADDAAKLLRRIGTDLVAAGSAVLNLEVK